MGARVADEGRRVQVNFAMVEARAQMVCRAAGQLPSILGNSSKQTMLLQELTKVDPEANPTESQHTRSTHKQAGSGGVADASLHW